jgi:tetratricopeptide (TPR) repeat protein
MFDALLEQVPDDIWVVARRAATSLAFKAAEQRGKTLHSLDRVVLACRYTPEVNALRRALAASSGDATWVHCQLIDALRCAQQLEDCVAACDALIARRPRFAWAYRRRAWAHRHRFDIRSALEDIDEALRLEPNPSVRGYRALLLGLLAEDSACQADFDAVMAEDATLVEAFGLERALFRVAAEDYARALPWLRRHYERGYDALRLYLLAIAVSRTHGQAAAMPVMASARRAAAALVPTEGRPLGEYLRAALALLDGEDGAALEVARCAHGQPVLLELAVLDPLVRPALGVARFERLLRGAFAGSAPALFDRWMRR